MNTYGCQREPERSIVVTGDLSRRAALGRLAGIGIAAMLSSATRNHALAQATPVPSGATGQQPNAFTLDGSGMHITYGTTSEDGRPILGYRDSEGARTFAGDEIHAEGNATLGRLVSVLTKAMPDAATVWLTLLLPEFNPVELGIPPVPFDTLAILTTHLTTIGGPGLIDGALQTYEVVALSGMAQFVMP